MRNVFPAVVVALQAACAPQATPTKTEDAVVKPAAYSDLGKCWSAEDGTFTGALASYEGPRGTELVLYSGRCPSVTFDDAVAASKVRVVCVRGITDLGECTSSDRPTLDEQLFDPGVRPEFPKAVYAIRGKIGRAHQEGNYLVFQTLDVDRFQAVPREMFGLLQYDGRERPDYIRTYLLANWLDKEGYRVIR